MLLLLLTFSKGLTPFFELFAGPLYFRLANYVQRIGWGCSSEKSNPWLSSKFFPSLIALRFMLWLCVVVVVVDFGSWVLPLSLNCSLASFPSTLRFIQRFGWGCSSKKSNPRLPRKSGVNSTVHRILASCTVVLKDGISLTLLILMLSSKLSSSRWDILYVDVKIAPPPDGTFLMLMSLLTSKLSFLQILDVDIDVALKVILPSDGTSSMCPQPRTWSSKTQRWTRANLSQR